MSTYDKNYYKKPEAVSPESVKDVQGYPACTAIEDRGISAEVLQMDSVKIKYEIVEGEKVAQAIYLPHYNKLGKVVSYKGRKLYGPKKTSFFVVGDHKSSMDFSIFSTGQSADTLIVTEGEFDKYAVMEAFHRYNKLDKVDVTSLTHGAKGIKDNIKYNQDLLDKYKKVIWFMDNDKDGLDAANTAATANYNWCFVQDIPSEKKDACDYTSTGQYKELIQLIGKAKKFESTGVFEGFCSIDVLTQPRPQGLVVDKFPRLSNTLRGFRPNELTALLAPSGVGKTTFCKDLGLELIKHHKQKCYFMMLEEDGLETQSDLISMYCGVNKLEFVENPGIIPKESLRKAISDLEGYAAFMNPGEFASLNWEQVHNRLQWAAKLGYNFVFFDHSTMPTYGTGGDERKVLDKAFMELATFVKYLPIHVIVVSHINRKMESRKPQLDENGDMIPFWDVVNKTAGRGSAAIEQCSYNLLTIEGLRICPDDPEVYGRSRIVVKKNRRGSRKGPTDQFRYDEKTSRIQILQPAELGKKES